MSLSVSVYAGLLFALPVILWQVWSFLAPALDAAAERRILGLAAFGLVLGAAGLAFGYEVLLPRAVHWLTATTRRTSGSSCGRAATTRSWPRFWSASSASSSSRSSCSLPSISACSRRPELRRNRRKGYFIVAVAALALPGPDPVTTVLELLPMWALFEGSIWLAVLAERRAAKLSVAGAAA